MWKIPVPKKFGGAGKSWWEYIAALEGLASTTTDFGLLLSMVAQVGAVRILVNEGTDTQKEEYLPLLLKGAVASTALTEAGGGSDVGRIKTYGEKSDNGYFLNGTKSYITNAPIADIIFCLGRLPELGYKKDITLFVLKRDYPGLSFGDAENMMGNQSSPTGDIFLNDVAVSENNIMGKAGNGLSIVFDMVKLDRLSYGVVIAGFTEKILKMCMDYANIREAFHTKIADKQYVQQRITNIKIRMERSRYLSYAALQSTIDKKSDASMLASLVKLESTEGLVETAKDLMLLHGHLGYISDFHTQVFKDAAGTVIAGGTSDIQRINIFKHLQK